MSKDIYRPFKVPPTLKCYVKRMMFADCKQPVNFMSPAGPTGSAFLGFHFRGSATGSVDGVREFSLTSNHVHIAGQLKDHKVQLHYEGCIGNVLAQFTALGLYQLLGITGSSTLARHDRPDNFNPELTTFYDDFIAGANAIAPDSDIATYLALTINALQSRLPMARAVPDYLTACVDQIDAAHGMVRIADVASDLSISQRQLSREFTRIVGLQPKFYCRVLQVNRALEAMLQNDTVYLADIAQRANFADQAHFTRVFREFLSTSPLDFLESDEAMLFHFLGNK